MTWMKEHKLIVTSIIVIAICIGFLGVMLIDIGKKADSSSQVTSTEEITATVSENSASAKAETIAENPFGKHNLTLSEDEILNYMHGMSHQKVVAEEKWIHYEMTNERIQYLISVIENRSYENEDLYLMILKRWADGDFSRADKDHNEIWNLQGGTIGKAIGVLTPEEEKQYLQTNESSIQ